MDNHFIILIILIFSGGLLGGLVNYFRIEDKMVIDKKTLKSILYGIASASLVPIFLKVISSDLLNSSANNSLDYFVFFGFCLAAGIFSTKFIDNWGKKVLNLEKNFEKKNEEIENLLTEEESQYEVYQYFDFQLSYDEIRILESINDSKFVYRAISKISQDVDIDIENLRPYLENLKEKELVVLADRPTGKKWKITEAGKSYIIYYYNEVDESSGGGGC